MHVSDVRDEAQMEIMGEREEDAEPLDGNDCQLVVEGLSRPYDPQMLNANNLLHKKGGARGRLAGMTKGELVVWTIRRQPRNEIVHEGVEPPKIGPALAELLVELEGILLVSRNAHQ